MAKMNEQSKSLAAINKGIATLSKSKVREQVQHLATLIVIHAVNYKDISAADRLCSVVRNLGMRNDSLGKWFVETGCAKVKTVKEDDKEVKRFGVDEGKREALAERLAMDGLAKVTTELKSKAWDSAIPKVSTYDGFNLEARLRSIIKQADKAMKEHGSDPKTVIDRDMLARAKAIVMFANPEQAVPNLMGAVETQPAVN